MQPRTPTQHTARCITQPPSPAVKQDPEHSVNLLEQSQLTQTPKSRPYFAACENSHARNLIQSLREPAAPTPHQLFPQNDHHMQPLFGETALAITNYHDILPNHGPLSLYLGPISSLLSWPFITSWDTDTQLGPLCNALLVFVVKVCQVRLHLFSLTLVQFCA